MVHKLDEREGNDRVKCTVAPKKIGETKMYLKTFKTSIYDVMNFKYVDMKQ